MNRTYLARLVVALGLAAAVVLGTVGTAAALPPPGADDFGAVDEREQPARPDPRVTNPGPVTENPVPDTAGGGTPTTEQAGPHASAPTANLRKLANALVVKNKGIYVTVTAPAGLDVGPVEISIGFGPERFTRNYDTARGADYLLAFQPLTGAARQEYVNISLLERVPGGPFHYGISSQVLVVPSYTVTVSDLRFATGGCDPLNGEADPTFFFVDPDGVQHRVRDQGDEVLGTFFARKYTDVAASRGLTLPTIEWVDRDPFGYFGPVGENAIPRGPKLLPFSGSYPNRNPVVQEITDTLPEADGDCSASVRYTITYTPTAYAP